MKYLKTLFASLILALGLTVVVSPPPASAGYFNDVTHAKNDAGYDAMIQIECSDGRRRWLAEGQSSPPQCGAHVERIIVGWNQTVYCKNYLPPYQNIYYYTGRYNHVPSWSSMKCYMQRPL